MTGLVIAGVALVIVIAVIVVGGVAFYNGKGPSSCRARRLLKRKIARLTSTLDSDYHCHREHATMKLVCHTHAWKRKHRHENELGQVLEANVVTGKQDNGEVDTLLT